jgi:maleylpyruvate isomerase
VDVAPHVWRLAGDGPAVTVSGASAALLAWVCGRSDGDGLAATDGVLPELPRWP